MRANRPREYDSDATDADRDRYRRVWLIPRPSTREQSIAAAWTSGSSSRSRLRGSREVGPLPIERLSGTSAEFAELWERRDLIGFSPQRHHLMLGRVEPQPMKLDAVDQDRTVVAYLTEVSSCTHQRLAEVVGAG